MIIGLHNFVMITRLNVILENTVMSESEANEAIESQEVEAVEVEEQAESTPAPVEPEGETVDEAAELRKTIAEKAFKEREARRRADELEKRLSELESKQSPSFDGVIPPMPDSFDDDFVEKMKAREDAIARKAQADFAAIQQKEAEAEAQRKREREQFEKAQKTQAEFRENASTLGVDQETLARAAQTVIDYGVTPDVEEAILADKNGPLMLQYLAANPLELADLIDANPLKAGMLLAEVKTKSLSLKAKPSSAPPPPDSLEGRGAPVRERGPKGATFE